MEDEDPQGRLAENDRQSRQQPRHAQAGGCGDALFPDQPLVIGSITKTFTASLILQLIHEGRLALDAPVVDYLPDEPGLEGVTVRELLSHTSGLADLYVPLSVSLLS